MRWSIGFNVEQVLLEACLYIYILYNIYVYTLYMYIYITYQVYFHIRGCREGGNGNRIQRRTGSAMHIFIYVYCKIYMCIRCMCIYNIPGYPIYIHMYMYIYIYICIYVCVCDVCVCVYSSYASLYMCKAWPMNISPFCRLFCSPNSPRLRRTLRRPICILIFIYALIYTHVFIGVKKHGLWTVLPFSQTLLLAKQPKTTQANTVPPLSHINLHICINLHAHLYAWSMTHDEQFFFFADSFAPRAA